MNRVLRFAFPTLVAVSLLMVSGSVAGQAQEATPAADCPATTTEENEAIARRWYDELWNPRDAAAIDALVSPDHVHHWAIGPDSEGAAAFAERAQATWSAFPAHYTVEQAVAEGDLVALRWIGQGAHEGEFGGIAATGKPVTLEGINIFRIECGKIVEVWSEMDGIGLRQQLGATDVPATAATPAAEMAEATAPAATPCPDDTLEGNVAVARRWTEEVLDQRHLDALDEILAPDVYFSAGAFPDLDGAEAVKNAASALLTAFPDIRYTVDLTLAEGDLVVVRWTGTGTHLGPFLGVEPTGTPVTISGTNIYRIDCGRIVEGWTEVDGLGLLRQFRGEPAAQMATPSA